MGSKIFINYRRDDAAGSAAGINEHLCSAFGAANVFMDVDNLRIGQRFDQGLEQALGQCDLFLAVIGPHWLELLKARRAAQERDYVREEIAAALERGVIVIPVTVDRGELPQQKDLPDNIKKLVLHQKHSISHENRRRDTEALIAAIKAVRKTPEIDAPPWGWVAAGAAAALVAVAGIAIFSFGPTAQKAGPARSDALVVAAKSADDSRTPAMTVATKSSQDVLAIINPGSGRSFRDGVSNGAPCPMCPEMVVVPAGVFTMGSPDNEPERDRQQEAQVRVTVAHPFGVAKYAVTFDEWDACVAEGGCNSYRPPDGGWGRGRRPVINVSWDDINWYIAWLKRKTGKAYRLLAEAEREYVTRAGKASPFWWGSSITPRQANYNGTLIYEGGGTSGEFRQKTLAVDEGFEPNPWGLYDVHGNVWEWTEDCWSIENASNPRDGSARTTWADCDRRVRRGGSWDSDPKSLRAAARARSNKDLRSPNLGFRVARPLTP